MYRDCIFSVQEFRFTCILVSIMFLSYWNDAFERFCIIAKFCYVSYNVVRL